MLTTKLPVTHDVSLKVSTPFMLLGWKSELGWAYFSGVSVIFEPPRRSFSRFIMIRARMLCHFGAAELTEPSLWSL